MKNYSDYSNSNTKWEKREKKRIKNKYSPVSHLNVERLQKHKEHIPKAVQKILDKKVIVKFKKDLN